MITVSEAARKKVEARRASIIQHMQRKYPAYRLNSVDEITYRMTRSTSHELAEKGGFLPRSDEIEIATALDSPNNTGLVPTTVLPEVTTIFNPRIGKYIYAFPADSAYVMKGQWRQLGLPAMPFPSYMVAREVTAVKDGFVSLGEAQIIGTMPEKFKEDKARLIF